MEHFFNSVRITNFKSLKDVTLNDCKRINLLIGKPNVGKSNILEALGLFGLDYCRFNKNKLLTQFVRLENTPELFFEGNTTIPIEISKNNEKINLKIEYLNTNNQEYEENYVPEEAQLKITYLFENHLGATNELKENQTFIDDDLNVETYMEHFGTGITKLYRFNPNFVFESRNIPYLIPPFGVNLFNVLQTHKELRYEVTKNFSDYGLKLLFDNANNSLRLMKVIKEDVIFSLPFTSIADTLQRIIFFKAAVSSNKDSILLFEEPEAHCFPPYVTHITQKIIDSKSNQFFVATHSPYVLTTCLEKESSRKDLAIFMTDFKDGQTVVKRLTDSEVDEVYEYGLDLFFNSELFTDD